MEPRRATPGADRDGNPKFPPPLAAGKAGKKHLILDVDLRAWIDEVLRLWPT